VRATWTVVDLAQCDRDEGLKASTQGLLVVPDLACVWPGVGRACVFELLLVQILDLGLSRGCAADLGTSRWQNFAADCDLRWQPTNFRRFASRVARYRVTFLLRLGVGTCCRPRVVVLMTAGRRSRSQPPRKSLSRRVSKSSKQGVNRATTYIKQHHDLAVERPSGLKCMKVCCGCGW